MTSERPTLVYQQDQQPTPPAQNGKVVVLGGGGGASSLLSTLHPLFRAGLISSLHGVIGTADDGGSTGMLRNAYGGSAWGDIGKVSLRSACK